MYRLLPILLFACGLALTTEDIYDDSWALIIGIDKYENFQDLNYAVKDAKSIQSMIVNIYNFNQDNVRILLNEEATYQNIRKQFSEISRAANENDRVLIYFAGHGETVDLPDGGEKGYLLPFEADRNDLYLTAIPMEELKQIALMSEAKHILYLIDACYGGIATVGSRGLDAIKTPNYIEKITKNKARQIITAGGRGEKVIEKAEWGHSAFTLNLNRGLKDGNADLNADNVITANELALYLKEKVTIDSDNQQTPQYGRMTTQEGEFVFVYPIDLLSKFSLPSSSGKIKRHEIAILDFESIGIGLDEVKVLTKRLTSEIISLDIYKVLDLSLLNRRLRKQNYEYSVCSTSSCAMDIGKLIGVKYVVVGSISKIGETYSVDSRMIDVESEESFLTANYTTQESIDDIITTGAESISYQLCNMEVPKPKPPTIFERINIHKGKIFLTWLTLWLGWGLLPA